MSTTPVQVNLGTTATAVAAGYAHYLVLATDGTVWGWGEDSGGQTGANADTTCPGWMQCYSAHPVHVPAGACGCGAYLANVSSIAAGDHDSLALRSDGTVWVWGDNWSGVRDNGPIDSPAPTPHPSPVEALAGSCTACGTYLSGVTSIAAGNGSALALRRDGTIWAWGENSVGELGQGSADPACGSWPCGMSAPLQVTLGAGRQAVGIGTSSQSVTPLIITSQSSI